MSLENQIDTCQTTVRHRLWVITKPEYLTFSYRTMGLFICEPKFLARPEFLAPGRNFGLKFWPGKNEPKILAWNSRPEFQAEISGQNSEPKFQAKIPGQNSKPKFQDIIPSRSFQPERSTKWGNSKLIGQSKAKGIRAQPNIHIGLENYYTVFFWTQNLMAELFYSLMLDLRWWSKPTKVIYLWGE